MLKSYKNSKLTDITSPFSANETWRDWVHTGVDFSFPNCYGTPLIATEN